MVCSDGEYEAARFLFCKYGIVSFPSPTRIYDLLTLGGIRIEVKQVYQKEKIESIEIRKSRNPYVYSTGKDEKFMFRAPSLTEGQSKPDALDLFMILFGDTWVFISHSKMLSMIHLPMVFNVSSGKLIPMKCIREAMTQELKTWENILGLI